ncbi:MAG: DUF2812 domain-containing protein [Tissierellales bacterium]|jgi:hypothetical protein|nr:DUF2812 domain-containing protein [Tissierellales bacterium]
MEWKIYLNKRTDLEIFEDYLQKQLAKGWLLKEIRGIFVGFEQTELRKGSYKFWIKYWKNDDREACAKKKYTLLKNLENTGWELICESGKFFYFFNEDEYAIFPVKMSTAELEENNRESLIFRPEMFYDFSAMIIILLLWSENDANYSIIGDDKERALYLAEFLRLGILIFGMIHLRVSFLGRKNREKEYYYSDVNGIFRRIKFIVPYVLVYLVSGLAIGMISN